MKSYQFKLIILLSVAFGSPVYSQNSLVGTIEYYGRGFAIGEARTCLNFNENDSISFLEDDKDYAVAKTGIEMCLLKLPSVKQAEVSFVCCNQPGEQWMVYVGSDTVATTKKIINKISDVRLSAAIAAKYVQLMELLVTAIQQNEADEDNSNGHAFLRYLPARKIQESFIPYANANIKLLKTVLKTSKYPEEREVAATVIAYYSNKKEIVNDLIDAIDDPDEGVRNAALKAVGVIADYAKNKPELSITIPADPFIELMNSISWTDRNKSSLVLLSLTNKREKNVLDELKLKAMDAVIDMAGWKNMGHAIPGFILLGRMAGWTDQVTMSGINNERKSQIEEMLSFINKK